MKQLSNVAQMTDLSPNGNKLNYLLSGGRVYASAKSWIRALQVPVAMQVWFETGLARTAMLKKDSVGGELEMTYMDIPVYRWPAVGELLRAFDREWYQHQYKRRPKDEQKDIENFHGHYEKLINWGYDLQERALSSVLNSENQRNTPVTQETLLEAIKQAVAPRLRAHDDKLLEHDLVIAEIKEALPTMRDLDEFITVKQAITEKGFDSTIMPLYPKSKDNLSSLVGKKLKSNEVELGPKVTARLDGQQVTTEMNTYRRRDIYEALELFITNSRNEQEVNQKS
ncbi:hypothetical protein [Methylophilus methylotrophus]|uniref:hypothetical protein n=1 Tax=Methylophilus methylotrophus TaxID=17 RepID=UPI000F5A45CA|nr:hypothetical protein [Methylophilus methylotrophus]